MMSNLSDYVVEATMRQRKNKYYVRQKHKIAGMNKKKGNRGMRKELCVLCEYYFCIQRRYIYREKEKENEKLRRNIK